MAPKKPVVKKTTTATAPTGPTGGFKDPSSSTGPTGGTGSTSSFAAIAQQLMQNSAQTMPSSTRQTTIQQTSAPDIEAIVNSAMQQMAGRFATPAEVTRIGQALLAAEKANPSTYLGETTYQTGTHVKAQTLSTQTNTGVAAQAFVQNLLAGTADVKEYTAATGYMDAIMKANGQFKGAYSG